MSLPAIRSGLQEEADIQPRLGRIAQTRDEAMEWAKTTRAQFGIPVRIYQRSMRAGGVDARVWVVVMWPKGTKVPR